MSNQEAIKKLRVLKFKYPIKRGSSFDTALDMAIEALKDRPKGEWKSVKASIYPYGYDVECSVCRHRMGSSFGYKYCPNCGADMRGEDE